MSSRAVRERFLAHILKVLIVWHVAEHTFRRTRVCPHFHDDSYTHLPIFWIDGGLPVAF